MQTERVGGGRFARAHLWLLFVVRALLRPFRHRGLGKAVETIGRVFGSNHFADITIDRATALRIDLRDAYWMGPLLKGSGYENEIGRMLEQFLDDETGFIDCGANIGYWSVLAARRGGSSRVIAVEPSPFLVERLTFNRELNGLGFEIRQAAVWSQPSQRLTLATDRLRHSWGSVSPDVTKGLVQQGFDQFTVPTITIDELAHGMDAKRLVVKLDVEGAEAEALEGARETREGDVLFIFEEHSRETERRASWALSEMGFRLFALGSDGRVSELLDLNDRSATAGSGEAWNIAACRTTSSFMEGIAARMDRPAER